MFGCAVFLDRPHVTCINTQEMNEHIADCISTESSMVNFKGMDFLVYTIWSGKKNMLTNDVCVVQYGAHTRGSTPPLRVGAYWWFEAKRVGRDRGDGHHCSEQERPIPAPHCSCAIVVCYLHLCLVIQENVFQFILKLNAKQRQVNLPLWTIS